jgi:hypothetical protein
MTGRERVKQVLRFEAFDRLPCDLPAELGFESDFHMACMADFPEERPKTGTDAWGSVWKNIGDTIMGEVVKFPLADWSQLDTFKFANAGL